MNVLKNWNSLGYDKGTIERYQYALDRINLQTLKMVGRILFIMLIPNSAFFAFVYSDTLRAIIILVAAIGAFGIGFLSSRLLKSKINPPPFFVNFLIIVFSYGCYFAGIYLGTVASDGDPAVIVIGLFMFIQLLFVRKPIQNIITLLPSIVLFITLSLMFKKPDKVVYDAIHTALSVSVGLVISYNVSQMKIENIITNEKLREANYTLYHTSTTDELTGLWNRRMTFEKFEDIRKECLKENVDISCIILDLDNFKAYNDLYGHPAGDKALKEIGAAFNKYIKEKGVFIGRIGGEEFMAVCKETEKGKGEKAAEDLRLLIQNLNIEYSYSKIAFMMTGTIGVYTSKPNIKIEGIYETADKALYKAKEYGKNCCWKYSLADKSFLPISANK